VSERADRIEAAFAHVFHPSMVSAREGEQEVRVCAATTCAGSGAGAVRDAFRDELTRRGLQQEWRVVETGCRGSCDQGPIVSVEPAGVFYPRVSPASVPRIVAETLVGGRPVEDLLYRHPDTGRPVARAADVPFLLGQRRLVLALAGRIDPASIDDAIAHERYRAFVEALIADEPDDVIDAVEESGLRTRVGDPGSVGSRWRRALDGTHDERFVVCTADEGDPGAFADRTVLESDPHAVIEGMLLAAFAIGARHGVVRVRRDHAAAGERLRGALVECRERGLLGRDILGAGLSFDIEIDAAERMLVCADETALIASLEGRRAVPRIRPPAPTEAGFRGRPTVVSDAVAYAAVPWIVRNGAAAYAAAGLHEHTGTRVFSLSGQVRNGGVVEVPAGTSLRRVVEDIGGGARPGRRLKAVQIGGPLGVCLPATALEAPIDDLAAGSSSLVVLDDRTCMVDLARHLLSISQREGCGTCVPCRLGTKRSLEILERIVDGRGRDGDMELLAELGTYCSQGTLCVLGGNASNPVLGTLRDFADEYEAHITERRCPAGVCRALITYSIDPEACTGCTLCAQRCPAAVISGREGQPHVIDVSGCTKCDICRQVCPDGAVRVRSGVSQAVAPGTA